MKKNEIVIFEKEEFGKVRTIVVNGIPYFVGKDVASVLGYADPNKAIAMHVDEEDKLNDKTALSLGQRGGWLINESGVFSLILSSKLPTAKAFKHWVTSEVLPQIRKTGKYKGKSPVEIKCIEKRNLFTAVLKEHGIEKHVEYATITVDMKKPFGLENVKKKEMPDRDKLKIAASETLAMAMLYNEQGFDEVDPVCIEASEVVNQTLKKKLGA